MINCRFIYTYKDDLLNGKFDKPKNYYTDFYNYFYTQSIIL